MEGFSRKKGGARELLVRERVIWGPEHLWGTGERERERLYHRACLSFLWVMERTCVTDYPTGCNEKIRDCFIKIVSKKG